MLYCATQKHLSVHSGCTGGCCSASRLHKTAFACLAAYIACRCYAARLEPNWHCMQDALVDAVKQANFPQQPSPAWLHTLHANARQKELQLALHGGRLGGRCKTSRLCPAPFPCLTACILHTILCGKVEPHLSLHAGHNGVCCKASRFAEQPS